MLGHPFGMIKNEGIPQMQTFLTGREKPRHWAELAGLAGGGLTGRWGFLLSKRLAVGLHEHDADAQIYLQVVQLRVRAGADMPSRSSGPLSPTRLARESWARRPAC